MKAVMISIQPKWVEKIANGQKTIEVRKTRPKIDVPFKCYIYCTKGEPNMTIPLLGRVHDNLLWICNGKVKQTYGYEYMCQDDEYWCLNGKVIGEFVCDRIDYWQYHYKSDVMHIADMSELSCVSIEDLLKYSNGGETTIYGWHITDLVIYDEPKELSEFEHSCPTNLKKIPYINCSYCRYNFVGNRGNKCDCKVTRPPQSWCYVEEKE